ncbi:MAG: 16S rRNA (cytosine(1402)-N(4))-methyltransferase RsmH [Bacteroidia bacterium]
MYHQPVMLQECIDALEIKENGIYVDVTYGGGGHSRAIMERLKNGRLIAFDQDEDALKNKIDDDRFTLVNQNFKYLRQFLKFHNALPVDGILADLGVSSHQFDTASRGFSTRFNSDLDMRMNRNAAKTAKQILAGYDEKKLQQLFSAYGEIRNAKTLAAAIVEARNTHPISTTDDLKNVLAKCVSAAKANQYYAQVFQALRIEVNEELDALKDFLEQSAEVLISGGRLVVMSYHSLEDRLVKNFISKGNFEGEDEKDFYGNRINVQFKAAYKKPVTPTAAEQSTNPRSRSAKLRVAIKI